MKNVLKKYCQDGYCDLMFEVTRQCNARCRHCLRGDPMDITMPGKVMLEALKRIKEQDIYIATVIFSGGEPSLAPYLMREFVTLTTNLQIDYGSFYIATNGLHVTDSFLSAIIHLYAHAEEKDVCLLRVSNDEYHPEIPKENMELLEVFSFTNTKKSRHLSLINQGRARTEVPEINTFMEPITINEEDTPTLYINVFGHVIDSCDWSYEEQNNHIIGGVYNG